MKRSDMYKKHILSNGLRMVAVPMKSTKAVTVLVLVGTGSKYEEKKNNGISHFLEHMFFKGTKKRPSTLVIAEILDRIGGEYNGFTSKECTGYWAKVDAKHLDLAIDWVSDIFLNSKLEPKEVNRQKGVIIEEINMYLDTPIDYIDDLWRKLLYGNQPAGWGGLGEEKIITKLKKQDFIDYFKSHYSSHSTVIAVAGDLTKIQNLESKIQKFFRNINTKKPKQKEGIVEKQRKPGTLVYYKDTDQTHLYLGVRGYNIFHPDKYVLDVLSVILGRGMSSRLWIAVRVRQGLAYYISTSANYETDTGYLVTQAGVDNKRVEKAIQIILKNYRLIKSKKVGEKELRKAKDFIKGKSVLAMEGSDEQASFHALQELLTNEILTLEEKFAKIEAVTVDDIYKVANDVFRPEKLNLALIGPFTPLEITRLWQKTIKRINF